MSERVRTDWENSVFARQPGLATERFAKPRGVNDELASEKMAGIRPLGQILKCVVNGQIMDFLRNGPLLILQDNQLKISGLVSQALPQADLKTGRQKRIQDFASSVWQNYLVIGPLTQIVFLAVAPDSHLRLVNFFPSAEGQPALLLFLAAGAQGQLLIHAPGSFSIE